MMRQELQIPKVASQFCRTPGNLRKSPACLLRRASSSEQAAAWPTRLRAQAVELFEKKVRPILVEKCHHCHGSALQKGGLRLDSRDRCSKGAKAAPW